MSNPSDSEVQKAQAVMEARARAEAKEQEKVDKPFKDFQASSELAAIKTTVEGLIKTYRELDEDLRLTKLRALKQALTLFN